MKSVMVSIRPKWCELIATREKTVEVRKTKPNIETPFKCYIYETLTAYNSVSRQNDGLRPHLVPGKVIGEFVCYNIDEDECGELADYFENYGCVTLSEQIEYAGNKILYGWHISNLVVYDKPKALSEFRTLCKYSYGCDECHEFDYFAVKNTCRGRQITRPPQSWCYVEEINDTQTSR